MRAASGYEGGLSSVVTPSPTSAAVVRRTLAARTRDRHLIDDLTQETLTRLADIERTLSPDAERAYAVVIARNLLASHFRGQSVRGRHLHRLVDRDGSDDPAQLTVDKEETEALASALAQLDPAERELLLRHEVTGTDLATLAGEGNVSRGAIAMRLARGRANLRLEFLLAFRRIELPTDRCRPVLLAMAVGDERRKAQLDAERHLERCPVCADLVDPMTRHDRRIAGWLLVPVAEGVRRAWRAVAGHPAKAASAVLVAVAATGARLELRHPRRRSHQPPPPAPRRRHRRPTRPRRRRRRPPPVRHPPHRLRLPAAPAPLPAAIGRGCRRHRGRRGSATTPPAPPCPPAAPLDAIDVLGALACPFAPTVVTITELSGNDGFTAVTASGLPVSVQLVGHAGPPDALAPGLQVSIAGVITSDSEQPLVVEVAAADVRLAG